MRKDQKITIRATLVLIAVLATLMFFPRSNSLGKSVTVNNNGEENIEEEIYYVSPNFQEEEVETLPVGPQMSPEELVQSFLDDSELVTKTDEKKAKAKAKSKSKSKAKAKKATYTEEELNSLASVIAAEAGGVYSKGNIRAAAEVGITPDKWQQLVGYVFINRIKSKKFPNSAEEVLYDGYAKQTIQKYYNGFTTKEALKNAKVVLENYYAGNIPVSKDLVYQAEFPQGKTYLHVGNTYFGIEE